MSEADGAPSFPLIDAFPALRAIPRVSLGRFPSPVVSVAAEPGSDALWIKREDLNAEEFGGNKVRALEFLLAAGDPGRRILTVGGEASVHALTTAVWGQHLGAPTTAYVWPHEMGETARQVASEVARRCEVRRFGSAPQALMRAQVARRRQKVRWIPFGGTSPLGMLGHVNAALELARQVDAGALPAPAEVVLPMGTGGTAAGLALGFSLSRLAGGADLSSCRVIAVRVGPAFGLERERLQWLAWRTTRLLRRRGATVGDQWRHALIEVSHSAYGGAYGRPFPPAERASAAIGDSLGATLDATYSAKACYAALSRPTGRGPRVFWLTFDSRWLR